jgi:hypothetical protein
MTRRKELVMSDKVKIRKKVQFFARTIVAEAQNGTLKMGVTDFSRTPITAARARTSVEFEDLSRRSHGRAHGVTEGN